MTASATVGRRRLGGRRLRVLALVVIGFLLLAYGIYRVGKVFDVFASRYELVTLVPSVLGLREGAPVTLAGQRIGQVRTIEFIPVHIKTGDRNLRLTLAIAEDVQDQIRRDSRAFLRTQGLLGDKFVDIEPGSAGAAILQPGDTLAAGKSLDLDEFLTQASEALTEATDIVLDIQEITHGLTRGEGTAGRLLRDEHLYSQMVGTTGELRRVLAEINRSDGTLGRIIRDPALYQQLHGAVSRVDSLGARILHGDGTLSMLLRSDTLHRSLAGTLATADSAVTDLSGFIRQLTTGEGTLHKLLTDPDLYDQFLRSVIDLQSLLTDVRENPDKYKPNIGVDIF